MTKLVLRHAYCPGLSGIFRPSVSTQPLPGKLERPFLKTVVASIEMVTIESQKAWGTEGLMLSAVYRLRRSGLDDDLTPEEA